VELIMQHHPLRTVAQDLQLHGQGTVLPLPLLDVEAVAAYLAARLPGQSMPEALAIWLHQHTDGNPLFLGAMVRTLMERGILKEGDGGWTLAGELDTSALGVPEGLRPMLEQQIACLPLELQQVLEVASVAGVGFATAAVAAGTAQDLGPIEAHCEELARQHLVRPAGLVTWPDGTVATRYEFTHALYQ
jgi:predicted ATPase